jgi:Spy/CpxP family protein refolding chaperone
MKRLVLLLALLSTLTLVAFAYAQGPGMMGGGYGMGGYGMGGYGMGGYGMGPGMMGQGYNWQSPECQKFHDDTVQLRKQLHEKRFDYFEASRNPKTTGEDLTKIEKEIKDLQENLYLKAPVGCRW